LIIKDFIKEKGRSYPVKLLISFIDLMTFLKANEQNKEIHGVYKSQITLKNFIFHLKYVF
jgi:hypothetical protein